MIWLQSRTPCLSSPTLLGTVLLLLCLASSPALAQAQLTILNWPDYTDSEVLEAFEREHQVRLNLVYFATDDDRDALLAQAQGQGYDVALINGSGLASYARRGWLEPLDTGALTQLGHVVPRWRSAYEASETHGVPYLWGTLGIAYRRDLVPDPPLRWMDLFEPGEALHGLIVMVDTARVVVAMGLKALGHSANSIELEALAAVEALMMAQRPMVKAYGYVDITEDSALITGEVAAAMMYSGDALALAEQHEDVVFVVPEEGGELWADYWTVMSSSPNKDLAWAFIDFMTRPENAARSSLSLNYPSPNLGAEALLPREFLEHPAIYPQGATLERSEVLAPLPPRITRRITEIHQRVLREPASY